MFYQNLKFPKVKGKPFFYTNFVTTLDGKVQVKKEGYWPIGSKVDHDVLVELRTYADCLIHGGNLAREFGRITLKSINKPLFKQMRGALGKSKTLPYYIITNEPESIKISRRVNVFHPRGGNLKKLVEELGQKGYKNVLIEGGPTLLGSFLKENLVNEIFLTIAPKIFGNSPNETLTLVEGYLFPKEATKKLKLLSVKQVGDELYLRYQILN